MENRTLNASFLYSMKSINPYTNALIAEITELNDQQISDIIDESSSTFDTWKRTDFNVRRKLIRKVAMNLRSNNGTYASMITAEMGKPLRESKAEVEKCAWLCDYYAENAERFLSPETIMTDADESYISYEPLGVILGIMPWNFPFWQAFRFIVPTLMAGNTAVLKHASNVQLSAANIENIFTDSGFPRAVFRNIPAGSDRMEKAIRHHRIMAVSLTGSGPAGEKVASIAGSVLKKTVLELGGSNAFIVLEDADIEDAASVAVQARFQNAGQSCIAAKRFIIHSKAADQFLEKFVSNVELIKAGNPADPDTEMGPLSSITQAETIEDQVIRSVKMGATILTGGKRDNAFYSPSVVEGVRPGMPLFDEEIFGPVAAVTIVDDAEEALKLAGSTVFGLGVSLFTRNTELAGKMAGMFHDGAVFINGLVKSDPRLPFGGTRSSGYGRELSIQGIREFVNIKSVWIRKT
ncbi:MAG TPA: NAD-dependent succinate-semialdehyde dehydrogenase [Bacteroidales bacterium]|nr:NAD-dependent succinate-semialdehyde dehydrogenase [Bacteroidales bacterium]